MCSCDDTASDPFNGLRGIEYVVRGQKQDVSVMNAATSKWVAPSIDVGSLR